MTTRWSDSTEDVTRAPRPRHRRLGRIWLTHTRRAPHTALRRWEADHHSIGASPRPGRHRDLTERASAHIARDTVEMPLASAFVPLAGSR